MARSTGGGGGGGGARSQAALTQAPGIDAASLFEHAVRSAVSAAPLPGAAAAALAQLAAWAVGRATDVGPGATADVAARWADAIATVLALEGAATLSWLLPLIARMRGGSDVP